jgi:hypothetical protein
MYANPLKCELCNEVFSRQQYLTRHKQEIHQGTTIRKFACSNNYKHEDQFENLPLAISNGVTRIITSSSFGSALRNIRFYSKKRELSVLTFYNDAHSILEETLIILREEHHPMKIGTKICVEFTKLLSEQPIKDESYFSSPVTRLENYDLDEIMQLLITKIEDYNNRGSNWTITDIKFLELQVVRCK